ncbi:LLM class F420-dependent oxidoreductase, partial [Streptomyces rimosus]
AAAPRGRDADDLVYSNALVACVGRNDAEVKRRADAIGREVEELKANGLAGSPAEVVERLGRFRAVGSQRVYLQMLDLTDLDQLELIASEVMPQVA